MEQTMGKRISELRKKAGLTQEQLANKLNVSAQAVSKWENDISCPDISTLPLLAQILGVTTDELLGASGSKSFEQPVTSSPCEPEEDLKRRKHINRDGIGFGIILVMLGAAFLIDKLGIVSLPSGLTIWEIVWPAVLLGFGVSIVIRHFNLITLTIAFLGLYFLLLNIGVIGAWLTWGMAWPAILVIVGITIVCNAMFGRDHSHFSKHTKTDFYDSDGYVQCGCTFGEDIRRPIGLLFKGGQVSVSFGSVRLDLTGYSAFAPDAELKVSVSFGELVIILPSDISVDSRVSKVLASVENANGGGTRAFILSGSASFGSVEIRRA